VDQKLRLLVEIFRNPGRDRLSAIEEQLADVQTRLTQAKNDVLKILPKVL
jgi:hypothetical protein